MQITLTNTGKRYNREWIFRHVDAEFKPGNCYAITGPNGSGKSTLLQVLAGAVQHSEGEISYSTTGNGQPRIAFPAETAYRNISMAAPYLELIEEMTTMELLRFHTTFKSLSATFPKILETVGLQQAADKQIRYFSSGMKQRLKLALAFFSNSPVLLLDEPTTNLDAEGIILYKNLVKDHSSGKLLIVCSNDPAEYDFCEKVISISDYK